MERKVTRRGVIAATAAAGLSASCNNPSTPKSFSASSEMQSGVFKLGIASGDPRPDSIVLWTHISPIDPRKPSVSVDWALSLNPDMSNPVKRGTSEARRADSWTFKAIPSGLDAGQTYYYQFTNGEAKSDIGRTRTLPVGAVDRLRFAVVSCANWQQGFFNTYDHISKNGDFDAMIHLGDYVYEYGTDKANEAMKKAGRLHQPPHEILTLEDYRIRHAQYRSDPNLQAATANMPLIPIWMPTRPPETGQALSAFYRDYKWGDLMRLFVWETRLLARGAPIAIEDHFDLITSDGGVDAFKDKILNDPARDMLGNAQRQAVVSSLKRSKEAGETWRVIANQVLLSRLTTPDLTPYIQEDVIAEMTLMI